MRLNLQQRASRHHWFANQAGHCPHESPTQTNINALSGPLFAHITFAPRKKGTRKPQLWVKVFLYGVLGPVQGKGPHKKRNVMHT